MNLEQIAYMEEILNSLIKRKLCFRCGNYQSHSLVYCGQCGDTFKGDSNTLTLKDQLRIGKERDLKHVNVMLTPYYLAAIHKIESESLGITNAMFMEYIELNYGFKDTDFRGTISEHTKLSKENGALAKP